ncbi:MAG: ribosome-associated translation inhibitor RaiA [Gammaproteobacteria bacterium]|jgi:putative sigma-54 modulation protein|nr:ribosomal subunit interface protein [Chromatiales bacterium]MCP4926879.1 ribosome-associated translation inhibitor RaiA [Gammaproteobacteria bacterium]MDP7295886.1 ribosome-associated translation inhibitor RaiA [Gammaproteobacteria bacterium]MDP7419859.1 ribosome-associated translation inhibitor RaiA [Gammaproteobacteria bacterium]MDP7661227.1 ribosome-associated translation inhibitor RaiA [Gammaproteobacteria bacterium]
MQVNLTGHHIEITPPLKGYVNNKISRIKRHFESVTSIDCILTVEKLRHKAEAKVSVTGGTLYAQAVEGDMYAAIDGLIDKLDRQIVKHKEKLTDHHARDSQKRDYS